MPLGISDRNNASKLPDICCSIDQEVSFQLPAEKCSGLECRSRISGLSFCDKISVSKFEAGLEGYGLAYIAKKCVTTSLMNRDRMCKMLFWAMLDSSPTLTRGFTIRLKRLKPRAPDFGSKENFQHLCKQLHLYFCFGSTHVFLLCRYQMISTEKNEREGLQWMTMSTLFWWRWDLVIVTYNAWNKRLNPFFRIQITRGQQGSHCWFFPPRSGFFWVHLGG